IGRVIQRFPDFGQVGLYREGARLHFWTDLMPHQLAVDEAQCGMRLEANRLMRVKVHWVIPPYAQDATALGWPRVCAPECHGASQGSSGQCHASDQASLEQVATTQARSLLGTL